MIEEALGGYLDYEDGKPVLKGAEFSLDNLLEFWSEEGEYQYDGDTEDGTPVYVRSRPRFSERDLISALINEVRKLRLDKPKG